MPPAPADEAPETPRVRRPALWLLLVPALLYVLAPLVANRVEPRVFGLPFLWAWVIGATILSPLLIWLTARLDPVYRENAPEPLAGDTSAEGHRS
ncbi:MULTISPECIES: DUF3311 domain-containing protein [Streptomyces]|uniref:DUF3311 domain-containing protein n=1 Tax=Streptomyces evansiae TaxID=3075535 RepID=A0ABD5E1C6_9ACTN|nr:MULTISPECIES: DUF3311 domain-containing protein [unclassified Streptomyces]MDT0408167.1 DUF3311 domain-containing protein [Streptomyces sp. DSM 41979]MDT0415154.1 DUF3311 domain-containing protein [Streptomyces sp. DSM 41982]MDT0424373.1 DUF3311 domain-containing protein [Streptomyces sp. DSM 41859]MYQ58619.1 DUF3311 domain-containing protein [Streptomyces sp. SID4926]MYR25555.1 DUF3311 domain-containing protein [Streptomyces sp. SID4945]